MLHVKSSFFNFAAHFGGHKLGCMDEIVTIRELEYTHMSHPFKVEKGNYNEGIWKHLLASQKSRGGKLTGFCSLSRLRGVEIAKNHKTYEEKMEILETTNTLQEKGDGN